MARRRSGNQFVPFLIGSVIGSAAALALAPASGKETINSLKNYLNRFLIKVNNEKNALISGAQITANDIIRRAENVYNASSNFVTGKYSDSVSIIDREMRSWRNAVNAAVDNYKNYNSETSPVEREMAVNETFAEFEDETLPKQEGMGRRNE